MYLDALLLVSDAQAFGAGAVSTNSIDLGNVTPKREIGVGEPMGFGLSVDVAATGTTVVIEVISATDAALTAGIVVHGRKDGLIADFAAGALHFIAINEGRPFMNRFIGIRATIAAGTLTATAWLTSSDLFSVAQTNYAKAYAV